MRDIEEFTNTIRIDGVHMDDLSPGDIRIKAYSNIGEHDITIPRRLRGTIALAEYPIRARVKTISVLRNYEWESEDVLIEVLE
jgi:hypothetical protein